MTKPWEDVIPGTINWDGLAKFMGRDLDRERFYSEAPAMWRWISEAEFPIVTAQGDHICYDCGAATNKSEPHTPDCEWNRIAKAIGYR